MPPAAAAKPRSRSRASDPSEVRGLVVDSGLRGASDDRLAEALDRFAEAMEGLTAEIKGGREDIKTVADAFRADLNAAAVPLHDLAGAQKKLCDFLVNHRLKLVGAAVALLVAVGAISPNAATAIAVALKAVGVH